MAGPGVVNVVKPGSAYSGMIQITDAEARLIDDARRDDDLVLAALRRTTSSSPARGDHNRHRDRSRHSNLES
jgi:hypothetical protein